MRRAGQRSDGILDYYRGKPNTRKDPDLSQEARVARRDACRAGSAPAPARLQELTTPQSASVSHYRHKTRPFDQHSQLCRGEHDRTLLDPRPDESSLLQPLGEQAQPAAISQHPQPIATLAAKQEQLAASRNRICYTDAANRSRSAPARFISSSCRLTAGTVASIRA
jgi:hypothetical protein